MDSSRLVAGPGFTVSVPTGWTVRKTPTSIVAARGAEHVAVTRFPLLKPYDAAKFDAAAKELDRAVGRLADAGHGKVLERQTTTVDERRIRVYRFTANGKPTRIGFVLVDRTEYQLSCSGSIGAACELLFSSFSVV